MGSSYCLPVRLSVTDRVLFDTRIVLGNGWGKITSRAVELHRLPPPSTALYFGSHMTKTAAPKPAPLYPTRSAAGALLGQQLAGRGYLGCLLLGIPPEGVEIAANASKAMGAPFDVLVAAFIKLGSNLAPIGARFDPSLMNAATSTSNGAPIALEALAAISTPSGGMPSRRHPR